MPYRLRWISIISGLLMVASPLWNAWAETAPAAMLADQRGRVRLFDAPHRAWKAMETLGLLHAGARLRVDTGARASLSFLRGGIRATLQGPCEVRVDADGCRLLAGRPAQVTVQRPADASAADLPGGVNIDRMGGLRRGPIELTIDPATLSPRPRIAWNAREMYDRIEVAVENARSEQVIFKGEASGEKTSLELPSTLSLAPGDYNVYLSGIRSDGSRDSATEQPFPLRVLDPTVARQIETFRARAQGADKKDVSALSELLCLYLHHRLYTPALVVSRRLCEARPGDPALRRVLLKLQER